MALTSTKCRRDRYVFGREVERRKRQVETYNWDCSLQMHMMQARQVEETACLPEDLREKVLTCQQSAYRTIRARDVHSETDICE
ncbi:hypothetical protein HPB52_008330 [Rhipicephalus sanguineus]|uniref:Uncharacterized protein n=1 Tax=Rhipicephalus sanguineus TaxID=34632 RepID=A0A9D4QKN7_RHISA|nr:hypothetical protein HPB52_008330 [Rhipicephalus sanguineus]